MSELVLRNFKLSKEDNDLLSALALHLSGKLGRTTNRSDVIRLLIQRAARSAGLCPGKTKVRR